MHKQVTQPSLLVAEGITKGRSRIFVNFTVLLSAAFSTSQLVSDTPTSARALLTRLESAASSPHCCRLPVALACLEEILPLSLSSRCTSASVAHDGDSSLSFDAGVRHAYK